MKGHWHSYAIDLRARSCNFPLQIVNKRLTSGSQAFLNWYISSAHTHTHMLALTVCNTLAKYL